MSEEQARAALWALSACMDRADLARYLANQLSLGGPSPEGSRPCLVDVIVGASDEDLIALLSTSPSSPRTPIFDDLFSCMRSDAK
jgi:hypothetical protein